MNKIKWYFFKNTENHNGLAQKTSLSTIKMLTENDLLSWAKKRDEALKKGDQKDSDNWDYAIKATLETDIYSINAANNIIEETLELKTSELVEQSILEEVGYEPIREE